MCRDEAREAWDYVVHADTKEALAEVPHVDCAYEYFAYELKPCAVWFWDHVWKAFIAHLQQREGKAC